MSRCPSVHQSHDPAVQSCSSKHCACKVHCTVRLLPTKDSVQPPPAPTRTGASPPLSDALIKVGLLPSCLHNNTLDSSSAADAARGSHYLARRRSLWLANGPGTAPVQVSLKEKGWAKTGHHPLLNSPKNVSPSALTWFALSFCHSSRMHLFRLAPSVLSHSQRQWTGLIWIVTACL